jgi:hypothetical protein
MPIDTPRHTEPLPGYDMLDSSAVNTDLLTSAVQPDIPVQPIHRAPRRTWQSSRYHHAATLPQDAVAPWWCGVQRAHLRQLNSGREGWRAVVRPPIHSGRCRIISLMLSRFDGFPPWLRSSIERSDALRTGSVDIISFLPLVA